MQTSSHGNVFLRGADHERDRASARGVQATDQNPDRATVGRYCRDVVLGAARLRADLTCGESTVGRRSPQTPSIDRLTSLPDSVFSKCRRPRHADAHERIYKARRNRCSDGRRNNVHGSGRTRGLGDNDRLSATHNIHGAPIRNRQCARANTFCRFELAKGKTSLTMQPTWRFGEPWKTAGFDLIDERESQGARSAARAERVWISQRSEERMISK